MKRIILGSTSPRRKALLAGLDLKFEVDSENLFDEGPEEGVDPHRVPIDMSIGKSHGFHRPLEEDEVLITADTLVIVNGTAMGKPHSREEAIRELKTLSGRTHEVVTGVTIRDAHREKTFSDLATVEFIPLTDEQIDYYIDNYKPYDKAGSYAVQEWIGYVGIKAIHGSVYTIMGLPVHLVASELQDFLK